MSDDEVPAPLYQVYTLFNNYAVPHTGSTFVTVAELPPWGSPSFSCKDCFGECWHIAEVQKYLAMQAVPD